MKLAVVPTATPPASVAFCMRVPIWAGTNARARIENLNMDHVQLALAVDEDGGPEGCQDAGAEAEVGVDRRPVLLVRR